MPWGWWEQNPHVCSPQGNCATLAHFREKVLYEGFRILPDSAPPELQSKRSGKGFRIGGCRAPHQNHFWNLIPIILPLIILTDQPGILPLDFWLLCLEQEKGRDRRQRWPI